MIATLPLAVVLSAVFTGSGALALLWAPDPVRPMTRYAQPAMSAAMLALIWTRLGALALSWPAILCAAVAGGFILDAVRRVGPDSVARALTAAASVWMLTAMPVSAAGIGRLTTAGVCAALLATSAFSTVRALPVGVLPVRVLPLRALPVQASPGARTDAGCQALMGLGMLTMSLAMLAGW